MPRTSSRIGLGFRLALGLAALLGAPARARADEALLRNGRTLAIAAYRLDGETLVLAIEGGGEIALPAQQVVAIRRAPTMARADAPAPSPVKGPEERAPIMTAAPQGEPDGPLQVAPGTAFDRTALRDLAARVARRHKVDEGLVQAMIEVESRYDTFAVSPRGAMGLMQLMPGTASRFAVRDVFDPADNVDGGVRYLKELLGRYSGQVRLALAAYNAGEDAVERFRGIPPYRETEQYVVRVLRAVGR